MNVHPSHEIGRVKGELRCMRCMVAPDWPLIESKCGIGSGNQISETDLKIALKRKEAGEQIVNIASDLGIRYARLRQKLRRYSIARKGDLA